MQDLPAVYNLHGDVEPGHGVDGQLDLAESSGADCLERRVVPDLDLGAGHW